jgi:hypothetical protein
VHEAVRDLPELRAAVRFVAVSFEPAALIARFGDVLCGDLFQICSDPARRAYTAFGLPRLPTWRLLGWRTLAAYARAALRGEVRLGLGSDVNQMGGDFVLDRDGIVRLVAVGSEPGDRPDVPVLLEMLRRWA